MCNRLQIITKLISILPLIQLPCTLFSAEARDIGEYQPAIEVQEEQDPLHLLQTQWNEVEQEMQAVQFSKEEILNIEYRASHQPELGGFMLACEVIRETVKKKLTLLKLNNDITNASQQIYQLIQYNPYNLDGATEQWMKINNTIQAAYRIQKDQLYTDLCHINHLLRTHTPAEVVIIRENHIVHADVLKSELSQKEQNEMQLENINPGEYIVVNKNPVDIVIPNPNIKITDIDVMLDYMEGLLRINYHNYTYFRNPENWVLLPITKVSQLERLYSILNGTALAHGIYYNHGYKQIQNDPFLNRIKNKYTKEEEIKKFIPGILKYIPDFVPGITHIKLDKAADLEEKHLHLIQSLPCLNTLEIPKCKLINKVVVPFEKAKKKYSSSSNSIVEVIFKEPFIFQEYFTYEKTSEILNKLLTNISSNELQNIDLSGLPISGEAAQNISKYTSLRKLNLSKCNRIEPDSFIPIIECLGEYLVSLDLSHTNINAELAMIITILKCPNLKNINLSSCSRIPAKKWTEILNTLPISIEHIALNKNDINEEGIAVLERFQHLKKLELNGATIPIGRLGQYLGEIVENLEYLDLGGTNVNDDDLYSVIENENLRDINIRGCNHLSKDVYDILDERLKKYRNLPQNITINDEIIIPQECYHNLDKLIEFIQYHVQIQTPSFNAFKDESVWIDNPITNLKQLETLTTLQRAIRLSGVFRFTFGVSRIELPKDLWVLDKDCFNFIIDNAPTLRTLHLPGLMNTPQQLEALLVNINSLIIESLNLSNYKRSLLGWSQLFDKPYPHLESLNLEKTNIGKSIVRLIEQSPQLAKLNLSECPHISEDAWHEILSQLPTHLTELEINSAKITGDIASYFFANDKLNHNAKLPLLNKLCMDNIQGADQDYSKLLTALPKNITHLSLQNNKLGHETKDLTTKFRWLTYLNLNNCPVDPIFLRFHAPYLEELHLDDTFFSNYSLGIAYDKSPDLRILSLRNCKWLDKKTIGFCLTHLSDSLEYLSLEHTNFDGSLLEHLEDLVNLKGLNLGHCRLDHFAAELLKILPNTLEKLNLSSTGYDGSEQEQFTRFSRLKELDLSDNNLNLTEYNLLEKLPSSIEILNLTRTPYDGSNPETFCKFSNLKKLIISTCKLKNNWKNLLENLSTTLEELDLGYTNYDGSGSVYFAKLNKLRTIKLSKCKLGLNWLVFTENLPSTMIGLNLSGTDFDGTCIDHFKKFKYLTYLNLSYCKNISNWRALIEKLPRNAHVTLFNNVHYLGEADYELFINYFQNGDTLDLSNSKDYKIGSTWKNLLPNIPTSIKKLSFSGTDYDGSACKYFSTFRNLIELDLSNCKLGTNWENLLQNLPKSIKILNLAKTDYDGTHTQHFKRLENLVELNLNYCLFKSGLFRSAWRNLHSSIPESLKCLHISYTNCSPGTAVSFKYVTGLSVSRIGITSNKRYRSALLR